MKEELEGLLFKGKLGKKEIQRLFKSQTALAREIYEEGDSGFASEVSVKTYLNRVINGDRPASEKLRNKILKAIKAKINDEEIYKEVKNEFHSILLERNSNSWINQDGAKNDFLEKLNTPGHHVFILSTSLLILETPFAKAIRKSILKNLGLFSKTFTKKDINDDFKYEMYVDTRVSYRLWQELSDTLEDELLTKHGNEDFGAAKKRLRLISEKPFEKLLNFQTYLPIAAHNVYLHNIDTGNEEESSIFKLYGRNSSTIKILEIPFEGHQTLRDIVYSDLRGFLRDPKEVEKNHNLIAVYRKPFGKIDQF